MNDYRLISPTGENVSIPINVNEDDIYKKLDTSEKIKEYYDKNGYVVIRNVVSSKTCNEVINIFQKEVLPYEGYIYRQASANLEKHKFTEGNHMLNSILNVQSLNPKVLKSFRNIGIEVLTNKKVQSYLENIFNDQPKLVQSMFFDGNPVTWAHQDTYYLDSENYRMAGVWFAMEDIKPSAGRFYVYPESQNIDIKKNGGDFDIAFNHDRYKSLIIEIIKSHELKLVAPALEKGDILIWHSKTIHGCLPTENIEESRKSFTGHFIPNSEQFLQYQTTIKSLTLQRVNGMNVNFPKDLSVLKNRMVYKAELLNPRIFQFIKKRLIKMKTK